MAATQKRNIAKHSEGGNVVSNRRSYPIATTMGIFMPGAPCYVSQAGTVKLCDTSDGSDKWSGFIVGISDASVHATSWPLTAELAANTMVEVDMINIDDLYEVYVEATGVDAAATQALVGDQYGLVVSTTAGVIGYVTMDTDNANATVEVVDVKANLDTGTTQFDLTTAPGVAIVRFLNAVVAASKA